MKLEKLSHQVKKIIQNHFKFMIKRYKNITIQKISDHGGQAKTPTHRIVVADENYENKQGVGKLWTKESSYGKFLSGQFDKNWKSEKDGKEYSGYSIVKDSDLDELEKLAYDNLPKTVQGVPDMEYPTDSDPEAIPF